jgi:hypothetical protein
LRIKIHQQNEYLFVASSIQLFAKIYDCWIAVGWNRCLTRIPLTPPVAGRCEAPAAQAEEPTAKDFFALGNLDCGSTGWMIWLSFPDPTWYAHLGKRS